jgi:hypothetical protein
MRLCPSCGQPVDPEDRFCGACGAPAPARVQEDRPTDDSGARTCQRCGAPNDVDALYCFTCGARLQDGEQGGAPYPETATRRNTKSAWIWALIAVLAVATAAGIGAFVLLGGDDPKDAAVQAASVSQPSGESSAQAGEATPPADSEPEDITEFATASASSTLSPDGGNMYAASNLLDGILTTCWTEGVAGLGAGETLRFEFAEPVDLAKVRVMPGYYKDQGGWDRWWSNGRLKQVRFTFPDGTTEERRLADKRGWQVILLNHEEMTSVEMTILAAYPASPGPHAARDTCVSEVQFWGSPTGSSETAASAPTTPQGAELGSATWNGKRADGYTCSLTWTVWQPVPADTGDSAVHPADSGLSLASTTDYDPTKDLAIPVQVEVDNSSSGFDLDINLIVDLNNPRGITSDSPTGKWSYYVVDFADSRQTARWVVTLDHGAVSTAPQTIDNADGAQILSWSQIPPSGTGTDNAFFVIRDYFTPAQPDGPKGLLAKLGVRPMLGSGFRSSEADAEALSFSGETIASGQ